MDQATILTETARCARLLGELGDRLQSTLPADDVPDAGWIAALREYRLGVEMLVRAAPKPGELPELTEAEYEAEIALLIGSRRHLELVP